MAKIENAAQLRAEIERLKNLNKEQEEQLKHQVLELREKLRPENLLMDTLSSLTGIKINKSEFLKHGLAMGLSLVLQRFVFKTETTVERKIYGWIDTLFDKVKEVINRFSSRGEAGTENIEEK